MNAMSITVILNFTGGICPQPPLKVTVSDATLKKEVRELLTFQAKDSLKLSNGEDSIIVFMKVFDENGGIHSVTLNETHCPPSILTIIDKLKAY